MAARALSRREALAALVRAALTEPGGLEAADLEVLFPALRPDAAALADVQLALEALAAVFYARPDLVVDARLDPLAALARTDPLPQDVGHALGALFQFLAASPAAPRAWTLLRELIRDPDLSPATRDRLLPLVEDFVQWREDLVGLDGILALAGSPALAGHRAFLLDYGIERFAFCAPEAFTEDRLQRLSALFADAPRYRYVLYTLAARRQLASGVRAVIAAQLDGRFPLHATSAAILTGRPRRLLVVQNIVLGQGDEIVRLVPLLQALLDANPALTITLIARRAYLYDCPRVTSVHIDDHAAVQRALALPCDGVIEIFQSERETYAYHFELHAAVERARTRHRPGFVVTAELGRARKGDVGIPTEFVYETVELDGRDVAAACGLDRRGLRSNYEPCLRLLAELGLPQRGAEESTLTPSILIGARSADAERVWESLVAGEDRSARRPVALVNPFGGASPTKGFAQQDELLAGEITGLVEEGYRAVILPNGTKWGTAAVIGGVLARLSPATRAHVRVGPDASAKDEAPRLRLRERPELADVDRVTRLFKYFATYADLVVTVEGWMAHLAYNLGRPFRLFIAAGSYTYDWYPHGRGPTQRLAASLSPRAEAAHWAGGLLGPDDPPPLPHGPRKALFELALAGLGRAGGAEAVALLERALQSPDSDVRTWAVVSLGRCQSDARKAPLLRALEDAWPVVVRDAATALLREGLDCSRELGPRYREQLQLQVDIARGEWEAVGQVGAAALPALFRASRSTSAVVAEEASTALRQLLASYVPQLPPERAARLSRRSIARAMPASVRRQARRARRALGAVRVWWQARSPR